MDKEKKSGLVEDREPQGQQKAPSKPQKPRKGKKDKAPIVEEKPKSGESKAAGSASRAGAPAGKKGAKSGESAGAREEGSGKLQVSGDEVGGGIEGAKDDGLFPASLHPKKEAFLRGYVESGGRISEACKAASCSRWAHYYWIEKDPEYAALFERMKARALDTLRDEIVRRGVHGIDEPQFYQGVQVGTVKRYSDNLLMFETKRHDPMYRDNPQLALGLQAGGDIRVHLNVPRPGQEPSASEKKRPKVQIDPAAIDVEARELPGG